MLCLIFKRVETSYLRHLFNKLSIGIVSSLPPPNHHMTSTKFRHFLIFSGADGISRSATLESAESALDADGDVGGVWRRHSMRSQTRGSSMVVIPSWSVSSSWSIHRQAPFRSVWLSLPCRPRPSHFDPLSHLTSCGVHRSIPRLAVEDIDSPQGAPEAE